MADGQPLATLPDRNAIYSDVSPTAIILTRLFNAVVILMVLISFIICLIRGKKTDSPHNYLLACNIVLSCLVAIVVGWWYRNGVLGSKKYWFIILVGSVIVFQCITTNIYVFHKHPTSAVPTTSTVTTWVTSGVTWNFSRSTNSSTMSTFSIALRWNGKPIALPP